jgi:hypothetical protein
MTRLTNASRMFRLMPAVVLAVATLEARQVDRFRFERPVVMAAAGPQRLAVDVPLLAEAARFRVAGGVARDGLADLRLFDRSGRPVPHLLVHAPSRDPLWTAGDVLPIAATEETSGFEVDLGFMQEVDALAVDGLPAPFLKRLRLEGSGDRERWTELAREGTLFDLPAEHLRQTEIGFKAGPYRYFRITWNDTNSGRVPRPASARARRLLDIGAPPRLTASLQFTARPSEPGVSRYRIALPGGGLPITALDVTVRSGHVFRSATVYESRLSGAEAVPFELGRAQLKQVVRDDMTAGDMRIPIASPMEAELDLVINDGSNPPLDIESIDARFAELPWIYFESAGGPILARYGNLAATPPAYDLEATRDSIDLRAVAEVSWGDARRTDAATMIESPAPLPAAGAPLDPGSFAFSRDIASGDAGLSALVLDAAALAHSRGPDARFADVRIIDPAGRQVPYLVERRDEPLPLAVAIRPDTSPETQSGSRGVRSTYRIALPYANLPAPRLVLETTARVFRREVQVAVDRPPDRRRRDPWREVVSATRWTHADQQTAAPALVLAVPAMDATELMVIVDEGDNAVLPVTGARLLLPSYRLRFYRPAGTVLRLVYGREDLAPPQYDLALLAPQVMGADARETTAAAPNEQIRPGATFISPRLFWIGLGAAVLVLLGLVARLIMRHDQAERQP